MHTLTYNKVFNGSGSKKTSWKDLFIFSEGDLCEPLGINGKK